MGAPIGNCNARKEGDRVTMPAGFMNRTKESGATIQRIYTKTNSAGSFDRAVIKLDKSLGKRWGDTIETDARILRREEKTEKGKVSTPKMTKEEKQKDAAFKRAMGPTYGSEGTAAFPSKSPFSTDKEIREKDASGWGTWTPPKK